MTREEAIRLIDERMCFGRGKWSKHYMPEKDIYWQAGEMAIKALEQPEQRWIPCTPDTMPEVKNNIGARVLITASWGLVKEAYYCIDHWEIDDITYKLTSVIAWMPMPVPYKPPTRSQYRRMQEQKGEQK